MIFVKYCDLITDPENDSCLFCYRYETCKACYEKKHGKSMAEEEDNETDSEKRNRYMTFGLAQNMSARKSCESNLNLALNYNGFVV